MSNNLICELSYDGKLEELQKKFLEDPKLASSKFQDERQPLHWACSGGHDVIVEYLLTTCNVPVDNPDDSGWTPLIIASSAGRDNIVAELLRRHSNPNSRTSTGHTALHYAASRNRYKIAEMLVSSDADLNAQDYATSATPLHRAASKGNLKIVQLLLDNKCKVDLTDSEGNTALHLACEEERTEVAELLNLHGASLTAQNQDKKTPLDFAPPYLKRRLKGD
ncbi:26S proteasome non-ATPase regulatory subunit 10-like [Hydractinia symbiolongicarpus]|uniref:26S proteasome non-ATPase regulatory subunit 10-like n=1 Tax=Hydractinia symbiolongicarpus TaxID=13093 RepID=UPI002549C55A|nr:26S proteasome non-ATPase regulatory subunit 10-like [Hydractinia symbiolongicarpus]